METTLKIDYREHALIELIEKRGIVKYVVVPLEVGDIHFTNSHTNIIIERKTEADLNSSIKDGRWREQKERLDKMKAEDPSVEIVFLIEAVENSKRFNIDYKLLQGAILNTLFRDKYTMLFTECVENTVEYIEMLYKKVNNNDFNKERGSSIQIASGVLKKKLSKTDYVLLVLSTIPRVSNDIAKKIVDKYANLDNILTVFKEDGKEALADIDLGKKKLGKKLSSDIYEYIFNE
jgi:crossover junction endonuclease MUS81